MYLGYGIIIALFIVGGLATTVWGWTILAQSRARRRWQRTPGCIIGHTSPEQEQARDDLLPDILFSYRVNGCDYQRRLEFPSGTCPSPELTASYLKKYPDGAVVVVYFDPARPEQATLEPGQHSDWLVLALGLAATLLGLLMLR
ncbi:MAG: DUF3592 domain-containing protein [Gammaproteobacteria bacterium]|nr:DUF3592 domain-containing protein [Gammaproteobacteria bacterium]